VHHGIRQEECANKAKHILKLLLSCLPQVFAGSESDLTVSQADSLWLSAAAKGKDVKSEM